MKSFVGLLPLVVSALAVTASAADGQETVSGGGVVTYTGAAEVSHVGSDLLLKFTADEAGTFTLPGTASARVLAVGGGGGGGGLNILGGASPSAGGAGGEGVYVGEGTDLLNT